MSNLSIPRIFPLVVSLLPLFVCGSELMSVPLSSGKGQQNRDLEKLEPYEGKLSCTVLRGEEGSNALDLPDCPLSRACNTPNGSSDTVLPYSMDLHRRTVCLDCLPTVVLRRSHSNDGERLYRDPLPVTFHRAAQAPRGAVNAVLSALCRGIGRTKCTHLGCLCRPILTSE